VCRSDLRALRAGTSEQECDVYERFESRTCQYSFIHPVLCPAASRHPLCPPLEHNDRRRTGRKVSKYSLTHTQLSPDTGNWRHSSTRAHCEEAASQLRSDSTRTRPSFYKWAPIRDFLVRSHRFVVRAPCAGCDVAGTRTTTKRDEIAGVWATIVHYCSAASHLRCLKRAVSATLAVVVECLKAAVTAQRLNARHSG
jgi:hypothetical protein